MKLNLLPKRDYPWGDEAEVEYSNWLETKIESNSTVGCFREGASPYGIEELSGNVFEWCDVDGQQFTVLRGGSFMSKKSEASVSHSLRRVLHACHIPLSFRCAIVPISHP